MVDSKKVDPDEAPAGYYAVSKDSFTPEARSANICRLCDFRPECQKLTAATEHFQRCSSDEVILRDGREVKRHDGCSVVFLKRPVIIDSEEE